MLGEIDVNKEILNVKKRNGRGSEPLNIEKIHEMVEYACEDIQVFHHHK